MCARPGSPRATRWSSSTTTARRTWPATPRSSPRWATSRSRRSAGLCSSRVARRSPTQPNEITVPDEMADAGHPVGSQIDVCFVDFDEALAFGQGVLEGTATREQQLAFVDEVCEVRRLEVVGVTLPGPDEVVLREANEARTTPSRSHRRRSSTMSPSRTCSASWSSTWSRAPTPRPTSTPCSTACRPTPGCSTQASAIRAALVEHTLEPYVRALALFAAAGGAWRRPPCWRRRWSAGPGSPAGDLSTLRALGDPPVAAAGRRGGARRACSAPSRPSSPARSPGWCPTGSRSASAPTSSRSPVGASIGSSWPSVGSVLVVRRRRCSARWLRRRSARSVRRPSRVAEAVQSLGRRARLAWPACGPPSAATAEAPGLVRTVGGVAVAVAAVIAALTYQAEPRAPARHARSLRLDLGPHARRR